MSRTSEVVCVLNNVDRSAAVLCEVRGQPTYYLHPGAVFVSQRPCTITTILGSCVSVFLWDAVIGVGGANHFQLPHGSVHAARASRFGNVAVPMLVQGLLDLGATTSRLRARVIGGACVMGTQTDRSDHLGLRNASVGLAELIEMGIGIVEQKIGGNRGRRVQFDTRDGSISVRWL